MLDTEEGKMMIKELFFKNRKLSPLDSHYHVDGAIVSITDEDRLTDLKEILRRKVKQNKLPLDFD